jgi:prepilin peptidase CpaA
VDASILHIAAIPTLVVLCASCVASVTDVWRFKVYNLLTLPLFACGLAYHALNAGVPGLRESLAGLLFGFGILIFPYMLGAIGAGDVKFVSAIGAWLGMQPMIPIILIGCLATGLYAVVLMVMHGGYRHAWANLQLTFFRLSTIGRHFGADDETESVQAIARRDDRRKRLIPFSAMVTFGLIVTLVMSVWNN